jgi:serine/threonine protein kinase
LFRFVCSATTHAHQKGIHHRDIKRTNILVTAVDGVSLPKAIDFGIAKALNQTGSAAGMTTQGPEIGTPIHMRPGQFVSANDVDTRSDIYSPGVVLHPG